MDRDLELERSVAQDGLSDLKNILSDETGYARILEHINHLNPEDLEAFSRAVYYLDGILSCPEIEGDAFYVDEWYGKGELSPMCQECMKTVPPITAEEMARRKAEMKEFLDEVNEHGKSRARAKAWEEAELTEVQAEIIARFPMLKTQLTPEQFKEGLPYRTIWKA